MKTIHMDTLANRESYRLLTGSILPRPIAFVTTLSEEGVLNAAPFSFFNAIASDPPLVILSVSMDKDKKKDTARNILDKKEFVVHIVSEDLLKTVNDTSARFAPHVSEVERTGLTPVPSATVSVPGIKEAKIRLECVLETTLTVKTNDLFIGRVRTMHVDEGIYEDGAINIEKLKVVGRLGGASYATLGKIIHLKRPDKR